MTHTQKTLRFSDNNQFRNEQIPVKEFWPSSAAKICCKMTQNIWIPASKSGAMHIWPPKAKVTTDSFRTCQTSGSLSRTRISSQKLEDQLILTQSRADVNLFDSCKQQVVAKQSENLNKTKLMLQRFWFKWRRKGQQKGKWVHKFWVSEGIHGNSGKQNRTAGCSRLSSRVLFPSESIARKRTSRKITELRTPCLWKSRFKQGSAEINFVLFTSSSFVIYAIFISSLFAPSHLTNCAAILPGAKLPAKVWLSDFDFYDDLRTIFTASSMLLFLFHLCTVTSWPQN